MNRMIKWIKKSSRITKSSPMLDIGCGNGMLAIRLVSKIYTVLLLISTHPAYRSLPLTLKEKKQTFCK